MSKKTTKIQNKDDYEKSSFKDIMEDMEDTNNKGLESVPKIRKDKFQVKRKRRVRYCTVMIMVMTINELLIILNKKIRSLLYTVFIFLLLVEMPANKCV